jgi:ATP adenylyltransferase
MAYVGASEPQAGCIFCSALSSSDDRKTLVLHRSSHAFLILNAYPYASGHLMAVPNRHIAGIVDPSPTELADVMGLVQVAVRALSREYRADGYNVGLNEGRVAGAGIPGHLHVHVVPRWNGDANFMAVVGETRVLPEALDVTWQRLRSAIDG